MARISVSSIPGWGRGIFILISMWCRLKWYGLLSLVAAWLVSMPPAYAQMKDTLQDVHIRDMRRQGRVKDERLGDFAPGQKISAIDSNTLKQYEHSQLSTLLSQQVPAFVRSYGFNNLATLSFRGSSAAQSLVLWNGVPLVYAALGMTDVSLLPVSLANKIDIVYGGSAALLGSGNVGGAVLLQNDEPVFKDKPSPRLSALFSAGSYARYDGDIKASFSSRKFYLSANVFAQSATNNFAYTDDKGLQQKMDNARLHGAGGLLQGAYKIAHGNTLSLTGWYQHYYREIPPALFETVSYKQQHDASLRLLLHWKREHEHSTFYARSAFIRDDIRYADSAVRLSSNNITYQLYEEAGWKERINSHHSFLLFVPVTIAWIAQIQTDSIARQTRAAIAGAYTFSSLQGRLQLAANLRAEIINEQSILLPGADASFALTNWLKLRANVQRTYRAPTLGELYSIPGGNSSLKPEQGWTEDAGYSLRLPLSAHTRLNHDLSYFNRDIRDWIIWFGGAVWTPHNIAVVHSRGLESENTLLFGLGKWQVHLGLNTSYVLAETQESYILNDGSIGKQIPYTPRYNGQLNIGFAFRGFYFNYNHTYTGYRFITSDESAWLMPYNTGNIQASYSTRLGIPFRFFAQCNNIWSQHYEVVAARPMPLINFNLGLKADIF